MSERQEMIGKVKLDLTWYPGRDLYSDGEIEDRMLKIAQETPEDRMNDVIAAEKDWAILYHMSHVRENIVDALPITGQDKVLEIGAGCGAITGALCRKAESVTAVDLSKMRSSINASRHSEADNLTILVGNFQDIEKNLPGDYDWITLIGVFEYAQGYIGTDSPYVEFLRQITRHLKDGGRLVIAIENRLGLKYWAGCREDHTGRMFDGLENYPQPGGVRTFSKKELEKLFHEAGLTDYTFRYPYPDYKLPQSIFSDDYLPRTGELRDNMRNFDRDRVVLFDETRVWDSLLDAEQFQELSNSFLVTLTKHEGKETAENKPEDEAVYTRYSNERSARYNIRTDVIKKAEGERVVRKSAFGPAANRHIERIAEHEAALADMLQDTPFKVNKIVEAPAVGADGLASVGLSWVNGRETLAELTGTMLRAGKSDKVREQVGKVTRILREKAVADFTLTDEFCEIFGEEEGRRIAEMGEALCLPVTDLDMILENIIPENTGSEEIWNLIDYEWTYHFPIPVDYVCWRIWHYLLAEYAPEMDHEQRYEEEGISAEKTQVYRRMEENWQKSLLKGYVPIRELYADICPGVRDLRPSLQGNAGDVRRECLVQVKADNQETLLHCRMEMESGGSFRVEIPLEGFKGIREIRFDPVEQQMCRIKAERIKAAEKLSLDPINGFETADGWLEFWSLDPACLVSGNIADIDSIEIEGKLVILDPAAMLGEMDHMRRERDAYREELARMREAEEKRRKNPIYRAAKKILG